MALESVSHIDDLNASNPITTDPRSEGDDHIRNIKTALKADFPNVNAACNPSPAEFNYLVGLTELLTTSLSARLLLAGGALTGKLDFAAAADRASSGTINLTTITGNIVVVTGTTAITAPNMNDGQIVIGIAAAALPLTYHATNHKVQGGVSHTCDAGDIILWFQDVDSTVHAMVFKANGSPMVAPSTDGNLLTSDGSKWVSETPVSTVPAGAQVQKVHVGDSAVQFDDPVQIPTDDSIPQNTEGKEWMTLAITPTHASNILHIRAVVHQTADTANERHTIALFQDTTVGALAIGKSTQPTQNAMQQIILEYEMAAGTTSSTTFKIRGGVGAADEVTFNGEQQLRKGGGVLESSITITETKV